MTRGQRFVTGFTGLIFGVTTWGVWTAPTFMNAAVIALVGYALSVAGVVLFTVVLEETRP